MKTEDIEKKVPVYLPEWAFKKNGELSNSKRLANFIRKNKFLSECAGGYVKYSMRVDVSQTGNFGRIVIMTALFAQDTVEIKK